MARPADNLSETQILNLIARMRSSRGNRIPGDDIAVMQGAKHMYAASDALIEGVHYRREWLSAADIAHKLFARNWSDFVCKGITPAAALLNLSLRATSARQNFVRPFLRRLDALFCAHGITLIGGDTARSPHDHFSLTFLGSAGRFIGRQASQVSRGDLVVQLGHVGGCSAAVGRLRAGMPCDALVMKFFRRPQIFSRLPHAAHIKASIDQSDSVMKSLGILAAANSAGLTVEVADIRLSQPALRSVRGYPANVLTAGEDLAIFGIADKTIPVGKGSAAFRAVGVVNSIRQRKARVTYLLNGRPIKPPADGFEHFA